MNTWEQDIELAKAGDSEAIGRVLAAFRRRLLTFASLRLDNRLRGKVSESDLVQLTCLRAFHNFQSFRGTTRTELLAWLRTILIRSLANEMRSYHGTFKRQIRLELNQLKSDYDSNVHITGTLGSLDLSPRAQAIQSEERQRIQHALNRLPLKYREIIRLRVFEHFKLSEIALQLNQSADTVQKLWWRGLVKLRQELAAD